VAKLYHKVPPVPVETNPEELLLLIDTFVRSSRSPAVMEFGEEVMALKPGEYALEVRSGRLWIDVWHENRSFCRRLLTVEKRSTGMLDCTVQRFGGVPGKLSFLDLNRPQTAHKKLVGTRQTFAEQFRRMLFRQFPGWEIETLSAAMDLRRSFSPVFPRARLRKGNQQIAAVACPDILNETTLITFALIWFDYVRSRGKDTATRLCLFLPEQAGCLTACRLRWLDANSLNPTMFRYNPHGSAGEVDPQDLGNLDTKVGAPLAEPSAVEGVEGSEKRLEWKVRSALNVIDPSLMERPVHNQVLTFAGSDRDIIDLLGVSLSGRLTVVELKTAEDIHLPIQALDYWMRVLWHAERDELAPLFPGIPLTRTAPRLLLVAPAMAFHSANATVLRYFSPQIDVERVGINSDWQRGLKVVLRLKGASVPQSHGSSNGRTESYPH
jgi:hypothetical protein